MLETEQSPLCSAVRVYSERRERVNGQILARLQQTFDLPGFSGNSTRGNRKGCTRTDDTPGTPLSDDRNLPTVPHSPSAITQLELDDAVANEDAEDHEEDADNLGGDIGGLIDYMAELPSRRDMDN